MVYLTYHRVKINIMFKISSKYLDVVLKASIISACLSSKRDLPVGFLLLRYSV